VILRRDAGFTLLELLVALAISSLIVMGIGGLFAFAGDLKSRSERATAIQAALVDLRAIVTTIAGSPPVILSAARRAGFELQLASAVGTTATIAVLSFHDGALFADYPTAGQMTSVDLSAFDGASIEYLVYSAQTPAWVSSDLVGADGVLGARINLRERHRHWPLVLWVSVTSKSRSMSVCSSIERISRSHPAFRASLLSART